MPHWTSRRLAALAGALIVIAAAAASAATSRPPESRDTVATIERIQGETRVQRNGSTSPVAEGAQIRRYDSVTTGLGSRAALTFADGSRLTMGESTFLFIADFMPEEGRRSGALMLDLLKGAIRLVAAKPLKAPDKRVEVRTMAATLSASAMDVWSGPVDDQTGIVLIGGQVEVRNDAGSIVLDKRRHGTVVSDRAIAPQRPATWPTERLNQALTTVALK
jgi:hypothetical protein